VIRRLTLADETGLVPIADRLRYLGWTRLALVAGALPYWWAVPAGRVLPVPALAALVAAYLVLSALSGTSWRVRRDLAQTLFGFSLLADGGFIAVVAYSPVEPLTQLRYLALLHVIAVMLLASFRTGLKITVWHSLLLWLDVELRAAGAFGPATGVAPLLSRLVVFTAMLWLVALCTAAFAAVNERELRRRWYDLEALARLTLRLEHAGAAEAVAARLAEAVVEDFGVPRAVLVAVGPHRSAAVLAGAGGLTGRGAAGPVLAGAAPAADALVRAALRERATLLVTHPDPVADPWLTAAFPGARNLALVPMHAEGQDLAVLCVEYGLRRGSRIEQRVISTMEQFAAHAAVALRNAELMEQLSRQASTDGLTGAANRRTLDQRLALEVQRSAAAGAPLCLLLLDVDHFKRVNDEHGHAVGDDLLRHLVEVAAAQARPQDLVARYGGEEFAVLLPRTDLPTGWELAERLRIRVVTSGSPVPVTISIGLAAVPADASTAGELMAAADAALYQAKRTGRNRTVRAGADRVEDGTPR
jgi:two-component system cell cycle response regulator